jgi:hypothetical protein
LNPIQNWGHKTHSREFKIPHTKKNTGLLMRAEKQMHNSLMPEMPIKPNVYGGLLIMHH